MAGDETTILRGTSESRAEMTRDEIVAFFDRRQEAYDNLDAARLAADYAEDRSVDSPMGGPHSGRRASRRSFERRSMPFST